MKALRVVTAVAAPAIALAGLLAVQQDGGLLGITGGVAVGLAVGLAAEIHGRLHPGFAAMADRLRFTLWILPAMLAIAAGLALVQFQVADLTFIRALPFVGALLCGLAVLAQDREIAAMEDAGGWGKLLLSLLTYVAAFALFTMVYQTKERSLVTATSTAALAALLSVVLLRSAPASFTRTALYAVLIGLAAGEVTWALNYWVVLALVGGAVLLLVFYVLVGVVDGILHGELNRRLLIEYSSVGLLGFLLILSTGPWRP